MKNLFINGSPNKNGNTAALAEALFQGKEYETLNLTDYVIGSYGQELPEDQLDEVIAEMDDGGRRIYDETLCGNLRYGIQGNGNEQKRSRNKRKNAG